MNIKNEINNLKTADIYSLMMFALYKMSDIPEYSALSQLAYILDKDNLLKLCEFYGGLTITIPTVDELENMLYALLLYQEVDIEHKDYNKALEVLHKKDLPIDIIENNYVNVKDILKNYNFNSGRNKDAI